MSRAGLVASLIALAALGVWSIRTEPHSRAWLSRIDLGDRPRGALGRTSVPDVPPREPVFEEKHLLDVRVPWTKPRPDRSDGME